MEAARSRPDSYEARGSRYDTLRVPYYAEDLMSNNPTTQSPFVSVPNSDLMRLHNGRTSNVVDFPTYSNEEAAMMNSMQPLVYADHRDFNSLRRLNLQNECSNWSVTNPTELGSIDHSNSQNAMFIRSVNSAPTRYLIKTNDTNSGYRPDHYQNPSKYDSVEVARNEQEHGTRDVHNNARGLSLSLSSNPSSNVDYTKQHNLGFHKCSKHGAKESGKALEDVTGISTPATQWSSGPLGPFTGYASILKSSKFLKPAQDLLDGICDFPGDEPIEIRVLLKRIAEESGGDSEWSSSSNNIARENQQKKATLFYMYDEVCRRYKHYYQQMQMVVSSFESVAGLGAATPYVYLALKAVTRNFKCLKSAISEQLRNVKRSLVDDNVTISHEIGTSQVNRGFQRRRSCLGVNTSFFDAQSHGWRPQRGLPERSVAVLRGWLFEHFLHPYPTDHDKHMLASQTGLSRNQVSNWFINARVRLWKPMVEEIHDLETKCAQQYQDNTNPTDNHHQNHDNSSLRDTNNQPSHNPNASTADELIGFSGIIGLSGDPRDRQWDSEIRSRLECHHQVPVSMEGSFVELERFPQSGVPEFGAVSLSLGLRHNVGSSQQQQQQHFGGEMTMRVD